MNDTPPVETLSEERFVEIAREATRLPTDYNVIELLLVRDCYEGQEASPWMGHTRPAAEAYASVPALCASLRAARARYDAEEEDHRLTIDTFRQQERIWQQRYDEQERENAALRDQLAEAQARIEKQDAIISAYENQDEEALAEAENL